LGRASPGLRILKRPARIPNGPSQGLGPLAAALLGRIWPLPALLLWGLCWAVYLGLGGRGSAATVPQAAWVLSGPFWAGLAALLVGAVLALAFQSPWRRVAAAMGFPLSWALMAGPSWVYLLALGALLLVYPLRAWGDAPLFPTPEGALAGLRARLALPPGARVLDAGCGLGAGLLQWRAEAPDWPCEGWEWSPVLSRLCAWRCRFAPVQRRDIWAHSWAGFDVVYLFQRPESMGRAWAKAKAELRPGAFLVSLEFEVPQQRPWARLESVPGKPVWVYRMGGPRGAGPG
jgi:hypothetical protein